jgi:hypothetical protein
MLLDGMEISIENERASVRGIRAKMTGPDREGNERTGEFGLSVSLRKENGVWLITLIDVWDIQG